MTLCFRCYKLLSGLQSVFGNRLLRSCDCFSLANLVTTASNLAIANEKSFIAVMLQGSIKISIHIELSKVPGCNITANIYFPGQVKS